MATPSSSGHEAHGMTTAALAGEGHSSSSLPPGSPSTPRARSPRLSPPRVQQSAAGQAVSPSLPKRTEPDAGLSPHSAEIEADQTSNIVEEGPPSPQQRDSGQEHDGEGEAELESEPGTPLGEASTSRRDTSPESKRFDTPASRAQTPATEKKVDQTKPSTAPGKRPRKPKSEQSKEKDRLRKKAKRDEERAARLGLVGEARPKAAVPVAVTEKPKVVEVEEPAEEGDDGEYCICKGENDEDGGTMVGCEMCDNWFHPSCIGLDETKVDMLDVYICSVCEEKTGRQSVYRTLCKRDECKEAAKGSSKFCSSQCAFAHAQSLLQGMEKKEIQELRALEAYPSPAPSVSVEHLDGSKDSPDKSRKADSLLETLATQANRTARALEIVQKRQALLVQAVAAWEALAPSTATTEEPAPKKRSKNKQRPAAADTRPCGWDSRLLWDDETVLAWDGSAAPASVADTDVDADAEADESAASRAQTAGLCAGGKRCERHAGWQKTTSVALDVEAAQLSRRRDDIAQLAERISRAKEDDVAGRDAQQRVQALLKAR